MTKKFTYGYIIGIVIGVLLLLIITSNNTTAAQESKQYYRYCRTESK